MYHIILLMNLVCIYIRQLSIIYIIYTSTLSPGLTLSTKSESKITSTEYGNIPVGVRSGNSYTTKVYISFKSLKPNSNNIGLPSSSFFYTTLTYLEDVLALGSILLKYSTYLN